MESGQTGTPEPNASSQESTASTTGSTASTPEPNASSQESTASTTGSSASTTGATTSLSKDELNWATLAHVLTLIGLFLPLLGNVLPPLLIWQSKRVQLPFAGEQALESLNFQISASIYCLAAAALTVVGIGFFILPLLGLAWFVLVIIATLKANKGERYRYPANLRLIK